MRHLGFALTALAVALPGHAADTPAARAQAELRDGCAQSYASYNALHPAGTQAPAFTGERIKGDNRYYNDAKPCDDAQYAVYIEKADPATVMMAYPSAAGRPKVKKSAAAASAPVKPR